MSVLILVSNGAIQRSNRICSQDQHADLGHISLGQQPILASMSWNVRNIVRHVRNVRNVRNIFGPWEHCSGTTQGIAFLMLHISAITSTAAKPKIQRLRCGQTLEANRLRGQIAVRPRSDRGTEIWPNPGGQQAGRFEIPWGIPRPTVLAETLECEKIEPQPEV